MDILDKFLRKVSYKFPKGYPDINNEQDMIMLEGMLKALLKEAPSSDAKEAIDILKSKLGTNFFSGVESSTVQFIALNSSSLV